MDSDRSERAGGTGIASAGNAPLRILVADDDDDYRTVLVHGLAKRLGSVAIDSVPDGEQAYRAAARSAPDLAVVDLDMPGLDGLELAAALRSTLGLVRLPIIVVSGRAGDRERELLARVGVDRCFDKPVRLWKLAAAARELLGWAREDASGEFRVLGGERERGDTR